MINLFVDEKKFIIYDIRRNLKKKPEPEITRLEISGCSSFEGKDLPIGLTCLEVFSCSNFDKLPSEITHLTILEPYLSDDDENEESEDEENEESEDDDESKSLILYQDIGIIAK